MLQGSRLESWSGPLYFPSRITQGVMDILNKIWCFESNKTFPVHNVNCRQILSFRIMLYSVTNSRALFSLKQLNCIFLFGSCFTILRRHKLRSHDEQSTLSLETSQFRMNEYWRHRWLVQQLHTSDHGNHEDSSFPPQAADDDISFRYRHMEYPSTKRSNRIKLSRSISQSNHHQGNKDEQVYDNIQNVIRHLDSPRRSCRRSSYETKQKQSLETEMGTYDLEEHDKDTQNAPATRISRSSSRKSQASTENDLENDVFYLNERL